MTNASRTIVYASPPAPVSMADSWYEIASLDHFWIRRRFDVLKSLAGLIIRKAENIAEVGCGNGLVQRQIEDHYGVTVAGFELNELALQQSVSRTSRLFCYDIHQRSQEFESRFDALLLFDVLEHIADEDAFLQSLQYHLTPAGSLILNVPAHQWLFSRYDNAAGHVRRYSIGHLRQAAARNGMRVRSFTYWGAPLVPLLLVRKAILRFKSREREIIALGFDPGCTARNAALGFLARCERKNQPFFGTSLMAVLEKDR